MASASQFAALRRRVMSRVARRFVVRGHMTLIFAGVVLSGVLASKVLLVAGLRWMLLRYLLAVICSYLVFFILIRLWLAYIERARSLTFDSERADLLDAGVPTSNPPDGLPVDTPFRPDGGSFGGGGASGSFDSAGTAPDLDGGAGQAPVPPADAGAATGGGGWGGFSVDLDEAVVVLVAFLLLLSVIGGVGIYLVYQAPAILAEAAFQVVLAAALEKSSRRAGAVGWSGSVFRATWPAFALVLSMVAAFGWAAQHYCPRATKLLEVFFGCLLEP